MCDSPKSGTGGKTPDETPAASLTVLHRQMGERLAVTVRSVNRHEPFRCCVTIVCLLLEDW